MAAAKASNDSMILGIVLIVLGILVLVGPLDVPFVVEAAAVLLIIASILMFMGKLSGGNIVAVILLGLALLLLFPNALGDKLSDILSLVVELAVGIGLLFYGILKVTGKA